MNTLALDDNELFQILRGLYCTWDRLTDELSTGPTDDNPGFDENGLIYAIRDVLSLMDKVISIKPEYRYLVNDALKWGERIR